MLFNQCSTCFPLTTKRALFHCSAPLNRLLLFLSGSDRFSALIRSYSDATVLLPLTPFLASGWCLSSRIWYSGPIADPCPFCIPSITKYLMPLFAPSVILKSSSSSKLLNSSSVTISPPFLDSDPPDSRTVRFPFFISHPNSGNSSALAPRHPLVVSPSQSKRQPLRFSDSVSLLTNQLTSGTSGSVSMRYFSISSVRIFMFFQRTVSPSCFLSEIPCTCKAINPSAVLSSVRLAHWIPLIHVLNELPTASIR